MNVVIYARYSSHNQRDVSIEQQAKECEAFIKRMDYALINIYADRGVSGTTDNRPQFKAMIKDAEKKQFQAVVVYQLDRFARDRYTSAIYKSRLKKFGVKVLSVKENISEVSLGLLTKKTQTFAL